MTLVDSVAQTGRACGCSTGALAALLATTAVAVWWAAFDGRIAHWPEGAIAALAVVGAALGGKLAGLAAAEIRHWWVGRGLR